MYNHNMVRENVLRVTAVPPGSKEMRVIPCIESEVSNLIAYLTRRGYDNIKVVETITTLVERNAELW